jgi:hypothetical protein
MSIRRIDPHLLPFTSVVSQNKLGALATLKYAALSVFLAAAGIAKADLVFDNISNYQNGVSGANASATGSTPNTFMGDAYSLTPGTVAITGFDLFPVNLSGTSYTGLRLNVYVWGSVNTSGTVNATTPAFGNLLGSYTFNSSGTFDSGFLYNLEGTPAGSAPGFTLETPLALTGTTIGLSFNFQGTTDGVTYNSVNSLTSLISYGTAPTVGSQLFNGYYRNAASESNGNFTSSLRSLGLQDQSLGLRIFGDVTAIPEPTSLAIAGLGTGALLLRRRRK